MRFTAALAVAAAAISGVVAQDFVLGFNSGASTDTGVAKTQQDFEKEFKTAKTLQGAPGNFSTIRLYSNIQWQTTDTPIAAFPAAIATNTKLLLGIWASGTDNIDNELKALESAIKQYGTKFTDLVVGISVGSEDLYRVSEPGIRNKSGVGNSAETLVKFIKTARQRLSSGPLKSVKFTHVDTWTAWVNTSNKAIIDEIDFLAVNAFPFYEQEEDNKIENAGSLLARALEATEGVAGGKDVWITETGWAYTGPDFGAATSTLDNAATYWKSVGCALFGKKNVFWYTLRDANPENKVKFAITDNLSTKPRFDLSCKGNEKLPSTTSSSTNNTSSANTTSSGSPSATGSVRPTSSPTGGASSQAGTPQNTNAGGVTSFSMVALSVVFGAAAWAL